MTDVHGVLDSALAQPTSVVFGVERYLTPAVQAAACLYHVAEAHAFVDRKRTAIACRLIWMRLQGVQHRTTEDLRPPTPESGRVALPGANCFGY